MIYNIHERYSVKFYKDSRTGRSKVMEYINHLEKRVQEKVWKYMDHLRDNDAYLDEPYSRHIDWKLRELRVDFANKRFRIFYFCVVNKRIIILHAYLKKTEKTPPREIWRAKTYLFDYLNNLDKYEK